jgi:APA family basic amino acid/polyamine antiporter
VRLALRDRGTGRARAARRLVVAVVAFLYSMWAIAGAGREAIYWGFLLMLVGLPVYIVMRWQVSRLAVASDDAPGRGTGRD